MALDGCCHIILLKGYINLNCHQSCIHVPISKQLCWHSFLVLIFANYIARKWLLNIALICISLITRESKTFSLHVCLLFVFPHELCWSFWGLIPGNLTLEVESCSKVAHAQWVWEPKHSGDPRSYFLWSYFCAIGSGLCSPKSGLWNQSRVTSWLSYSPNVWPGVSGLTSLRISFLTCGMGHLPCHAAVRCRNRLCGVPSLGAS